MSFQIKKYFPNSTKIIIAIFTIVGGVIFSLHVYSKSNDLIHTLKWGIGFTAFMLLYLVFSEIIDRKQHKSKLNNKNFQRIKDKFNFEIENRNDYWGFKGKYNGYFVRVFFDNLVRGGRLGILIYYQEQRKQNGKIDYAELDKINKRFELKGMFRSTSRFYDCSHVRIFTTGAFNRRSSKIIQLIKDGQNTIEQSGLKPISERDVEALMKEEPFVHSPQTETFEN